MGRDRNWVVRITTAECAVELRCSAGGVCSVVLQCGFAVGCEDSEDTRFCPLRIMWCAPEQKMLSKSSVYAGLRHYKRSFDNKLITVTQVRLFLRISGLQVEE